MKKGKKGSSLLNGNIIKIIHHKLESYTVMKPKFMSLRITHLPANIEWIFPDGHIESSKVEL